MKNVVSVSLVFLLLALTIGNMNVVTSNDTPNEDLVFTPSQYIEHDPIVIESDADFIDQGWPGNGTEEDPYVLEGFSISVSSTDKCIEMSDTTSYVLIRQCNFSTGTDINSEIAITLYNTNNVVMEENLFFSFHAIELRFTNGCEFRSNIMSRRGGIYLFKSNNCQINENQFSSYKQDPNCAASLIDLTSSNNCTIKQNTISKCNSAIMLYRSNNTEVITNYIFSNEDGGIFCGNSFYSLIFNNTIYSNEGHGITLYSSSDNIIHSNYIGGNSPNARDQYGVSNQWDDGVSIGNFWDDYSGLGSYEIEGSTNSSDHFPILWPLDLWGPDFQCEYPRSLMTVTIGEGYEWVYLDYYIFSINVTDPSGVDCAQIVKYEHLGYGEYNLHYYTMAHNPLPDNPNRYTYNYTFERGYPINFYFFANDTLGNYNITTDYWVENRIIVPISSEPTENLTDESDTLPDSTDGSGSWINDIANIFLFPNIVTGICCGIIIVVIIDWFRKSR